MSSTVPTKEIVCLRRPSPSISLLTSAARSTCGPSQSPGTGLPSPAQVRPEYSGRRVLRWDCGIVTRMTSQRSSQLLKGSLREKTRGAPDSMILIILGPSDQQTSRPLRSGTIHPDAAARAMACRAACSSTPSPLSTYTSADVHTGCPVGQTSSPRMVMSSDLALPGVSDAPFGFRRAEGASLCVGIVLPRLVTFDLQRH